MAVPWLAIAAIAAPLIMQMLQPKQQGGGGGGVSLTPPGAGMVGGGGGGSSILRSPFGTPQNSAVEMMQRSMPFLDTPQFGQNTPSGVPDYIKQSTDLMGLLSMFGNRGGGGIPQIPGI